MNIFLKWAMAIHAIFTYYNVTDILEYDNFTERKNCKNPIFILVNITDEEEEDIIGIEQQLYANDLNYVRD